MLSCLQAWCEGGGVRPAPVYSSSRVQSRSEQGCLRSSIVRNSPAPLHKSRERCGDPYQRNCYSHIALQYKLLRNIQPLTLVRVTRSRVATGDVSTRTVRRRLQDVLKVKELIAGRDSAPILKRELLALSKDDRNQLLRDSGMTIDIPPEQGLAMKADLAISWNKLRVIRRYVH